MAIALGVAVVAGATGGGCGASGASPGSGGNGFGGGTSTTVTTTSGSTTNFGGFGGGSSGGGIAAACQHDSDCGSGLSCLTDSARDPIFGGGPAGGFCTRSCDSNANCPEPNGVCLQIDPMQSGRCTLSCKIGPAIKNTELADALDPSKCRGREDLRCDNAKDDVGYCLPTCGKDAQCPNARVCDPRLAVCVDMPTTGLGPGAACDPTEPFKDCAGRCVGFDNGVAMCASPCVLGGEKIDTADCGGPENGFCYFHPPPNGLGDGGFCSPSCSLHTDCQNPSFWCFALPGVTEETQRGYCFGATACPNGQDDCAAGGVGNLPCTDTEHGKFCLDPAYSGGTGGGGGMGTGGMGTGGMGTGGMGTGGSSAGGAGTGGTGTGSGGSGP